MQPFKEKIEEIRFILSDILFKAEKALENPIAKSQIFKIEQIDEYWDSIK